MKRAPFREQLCSRVYVFGVYFAMLHILSINFYVVSSASKLGPVVWHSASGFA